MKLRNLVVLGVIALLFLAISCQRQPAEMTEELKRDLDRLTMQIDELDKKITDVEAAVASLRSNFEANTSSLVSRIEKIKDSQRTIKGIHGDINNRLSGELLAIGRGKPWPPGVKVLLIVIIIVLILILYKILAGRKREEIEEEEEIASLEPREEEEAAEEETKE